MAKFDIAEKITGGNEGGYANDPDDTGGETYAGISRNNFPLWSGWRIIDKIKSSYGKSAKVINKHARANSLLIEKISSFYKKNFWDVNKLDQFDDQQLANTVYDFGVNSGVVRAAKFLQAAVATIQDGKIGPHTLAAVNRLDPEKTHDKFNGARETFYRTIAKGSQAKFLKSWLRRLKPYEKK